LKELKGKRLRKARGGPREGWGRAFSISMPHQDGSRKKRSIAKEFAGIMEREKHNNVRIGN